MFVPEGINPLSLNWVLALKSICSATIRIPYKKMFGFVSVAGLMPSATLTSRGFMPAGLYMSPVKKYADAGASITLGDLNGFLLVRDSYSWSGYSLFWCSGASARQVMISPNGIAYSVTYESGVGYKLTNNSDRRRAYSYIYQNIPIAE